MRPSLTLTGISDRSIRHPYSIAICSHKGGTGRTTIALALAWLLGQQGYRVVLIDCDPTQSASLIALDSAGVCRWNNVRLITSLPDTTTSLSSSPTDYVILDCPALTESAALATLQFADGFILTCLPDPLSVRTLSSATSTLNHLREVGGTGCLLGLLINQFERNNPGHDRFLRYFEAQSSIPLLGPAIPIQREIRDWSLHPGSGLPGGIVRAILYEVIHNSIVRDNNNFVAFRKGTSCGHC